MVTELAANSITAFDATTGTLTIDSCLNDIATTIDNSISSGTYYVQSQWNVPETPPEEVFKQIVSLLGIKIKNVSINNGVVILYGTRNKKKFMIEISAGMIVVKNEKGNVVSTIYINLRNGDTISVPSVGSGTITPANPWITQPAQPYVYPYTTTTTTGGDITYWDNTNNIGNYSITVDNVSV